MANVMTRDRILPLIDKSGLTILTLSGSYYKCRIMDVGEMYVFFREDDNQDRTAIQTVLLRSVVRILWREEVFHKVEANG